MQNSNAPETPTIAHSARTISLCVAASRITGFVRTWAMAFALGATALSSSYQVANNLPNQLYELVMGGMLVTSFLPVYMTVKKQQGTDAGNTYASNLLSLVLVFLGIVAILCMVFPQTIIYTQSFMTEQSQMTTAVLLFQFFAIQTVFYGASTILSGLLNANREYFWSSAAPIFNNLIVIATFVLYAFTAPHNPTLGLYIIALGNPAGVLVQVLMQVPALKQSGIALRLYINLKDPALKDTLKLGIPALAITVCTFATVSVMNAASFAFADNGPSVIAYARLWYTLPYSFLAIPLTTALFTEISDMHAEGNIQGVMEAVQAGTCQILFLLMPFVLFLGLFAPQLVALYHTGAFEADRISQIAKFLVALAVALPWYGMLAYMQKVFSSLRRLDVFAWFNVAGSVLQVALTLGAAYSYQAGITLFSIEEIAFASAAFYVVVDVLCVAYLKRRFGNLSVKAMLISLVRGFALGFLGTLAGALVVFVFSVSSSASAMQEVWMAAVCLLLGGALALGVTFGLALKLNMRDAQLIHSLCLGLCRRVKR